MAESREHCARSGAKGHAWQRGHAAGRRRKPAPRAKKKELDAGIGRPSHAAAAMEMGAAAVLVNTAIATAADPAATAAQAQRVA